MVRTSGFQFHVAIANGARLPVRTDPEAAKQDARVLGKSAKVIPLLTRQARPLIEADARGEFTPQQIFA